MITRIRQNDPCPCGKKRPNGLPMKFKKCCGNKLPRDIGIFVAEDNEDQPGRVGSAHLSLQIIITPHLLSLPSHPYLHERL